MKTNKKLKNAVLLISNLLVIIIIISCKNNIVDEPIIEPRPVIRLAGEYFYADWGPTGRLAVIYMQQTEDGENHYLETRGLYTIRIDGTDRQLVLLNSDVGDFILNPVWSPDGEWIAFSAGGEIFKVRPDGSDLTRLTYGGGIKFGPSWSPDGDGIAFRVFYGPGDALGLWKVRTDGKSIIQFRKPPPEERCPGCGGGDNAIWGVGSGVSWSSNGREILYVEDSYNRHLAIYDTTTARVEFIYYAPSTIYRPSFSPDGSEILFVVGRLNGHPGGIALINRDGSGLRWLRQDG